MRSLKALVLAPFALAATFAAYAVPAHAATFSNPAPIAMNDGGSCNSANDPLAPGSATSVIAVSGLAGTVTDVNVTLTGLTHTFPNDVDLLLVGPNLQTTILMADTGGGVDVGGVNLTFDDAAAASLPDKTQIASGTYKLTIGTTSVGDGCHYPSSFPAPAPAGPYGSALSIFNGTGPNGTWSLYVVDDTNGDIGSISGGWTLNITTTTTAVRVLAFTATAGARGTTLRWRTASELDLLGFNVYRQVHGQRVKVNARLIRAHGAGAYSFLDRMAPRASVARYWIQAVNLDGSRTWYGPAKAARTQSPMPRQTENATYRR